ncbi:carboxylate--amine ligase/circularly permuted type 2 ATP-grasp protein [Planomonospora sp. ID91781]|uniref:carboxylate--amine ligase/circularly permuted type 2 ATP-grasp protein n=1 Tax=Planomonospora sp. ID91781 TaxID=2738135 RepID=UPI0018C3D7BC|nr:carboxylate--amine ligase/circularly permuted type 2 ATP-grasp protein [Planomonospora sp. ID91781]MBG0822087.1 carboxylate--amine ligase/circularly permuted type 2 ATP-grasp protein [Planomonospora sp. ID91781]
MAGLAEPIAVGVEEEFHVVDAGTRRLVPRAGLLLEQLPEDRFTHELQRSVVEANSRPFVRLEDLGHDLTALRRKVIRAADGVGLGIAAAGTVPLVDLEALKISPDPRYEQMLADYQLLTREQLICGTQVHAEVADRDLAVAVAHRLAPWLPPLLALSTSSPYWLGSDTGYAGYRPLVWQRWPTAGPVAAFSSAAEYDRVIEELVRSGVITDPGMVYFDVRPSAHVPTVELRLCDACPLVSDIVLIAGLFRALVARELEAAADGTGGRVRLEMVRAATWRAARSGLEGELVDPVGGLPRPAAEVVRSMVAGLRPQLEQTGDWELVTSLAEEALARGSSAARQRAAFARNGRLSDVVDLVLAETRSQEWETAFGGPSPRMRTSLLDGYEAPGDEVVIEGTVREPYQPVLRVLDRLGPGGLREREQRRDRHQREHGMTFQVEGEGSRRIFPFDLVPRLVPPGEWAELQRALPQRVRALEAFLHDVYSERRVIADGVLPAWVVDESPGHRRAGRRVPRDAVRCSVAGLDLVRDDVGRWMVLEDNLRVPSGLGYAVANRRLMDEVLPELVPGGEFADPAGALRLLRETLAAAGGGGSPSLAVVSAGPGDSAFYEHRMLAEELGAVLVGPGDLEVRRGRVEAAGRPVDVLYRRIDSDELLAGPAGEAILDAVERSALVLANAPGNGVADDKSLYRYVPRLIEYYLGEQPLIGNVTTYLCRDPEDRQEVLDRLAELVVKPVDGFGGQGVVIGPDASPEELRGVRERILADPDRWVAQETVRLSTHPVFDGERLSPRVVDLRAFVCLGETAQVPPAALTRVAPADSMIVNSSQGGGTKDTWLPRGNDVRTER